MLRHVTPINGRSASICGHPIMVKNIDGGATSIIQSNLYRLYDYTGIVPPLSPSPVSAIKLSAPNKASVGEAGYGRSRAYTDDHQGARERLLLLLTTEVFSP